MLFALEWHRATMTAWSLGTWKKCNYPLGKTYKVGEILWKLLYLTMKMLTWFLQTKPEKNVNPFAWANNAYTCCGCLTQHVYMYMLKLSVPDRVDTAGRAKVFYLRKEWREVGPARRVTWQAESPLLFCMKTVHHIKYIINLRKLAFSCYNVETNEHSTKDKFSPYKWGLSGWTSLA